MNPAVARNLHNKPPMVRHSSDLSWRISALKEAAAAGAKHGISAYNKSESSNCINRCPSKQSLSVPAANESILNINANPVYNPKTK